MELTKLHKLQSIISIFLQLHTDGGVVHSKFCSFILSLFATLLFLYFFSCSYLFKNSPGSFDGSKI